MARTVGVTVGVTKSVPVGCGVLVGTTVLVLMGMEVLASVGVLVGVEVPGWSTATRQIKPSATHGTSITRANIINVLRNAFLLILLLLSNYGPHPYSMIYTIKYMSPLLGHRIRKPFGR